MNSLRARPHRVLQLVRDCILGGRDQCSDLRSNRSIFVVNTRSLATAPGKKKVIPAKKPARKKSSSAKTKKSGAGEEDSTRHPSQRFNSILEAVLLAPSPVQHLKPKEKLRELELEKLGLVSKDKQKLQEAEKDKLKAKAKAEEKSKGKKKDTVEEAAAEQSGGKSPDEAVTTMELIPEEATRLAKEYSRFLMKGERARAAAESMRLELKKAAIEALPLHLQGPARLPDLTPFPLRRIPAALSPPVGGYVEELALAAERASSIRKSR